MFVEELWEEEEEDVTQRYSVQVQAQAQEQEVVVVMLRWPEEDLGAASCRRASAASAFVSLMVDPLSQLGLESSLALWNFKELLARERKVEGGRVW